MSEEPENPEPEYEFSPEDQAKIDRVRRIGDAICRWMIGITVGIVLLALLGSIVYHSYLYLNDYFSIYKK